MIDNYYTCVVAPRAGVEARVCVSATSLGSSMLDHCHVHAVAWRVCLYVRVCVSARVLSLGSNMCDNRYARAVVPHVGFAACVCRCAYP
jgi:hypothetical protein